MTSAAPASSDDTTAARLRALLVRAPTAVAFVSGQRFEVVSEEFNHLFGFSDDADLTGAPEFGAALRGLAERRCALLGTKGAAAAVVHRIRTAHPPR